jgi:hypothetical protein
MSYATALSFDMSPVRLSYVAALRGVSGMHPDAAFRYAQTGSFEVKDLLCLAASNPQGQFYGLLENDTQAAEAAAAATSRKVPNIGFVTSAKELPHDLNYLFHDATKKMPPPQERETLFAMAQEHLAAGGLLATSYRAVKNADETLRFLIAEYAPELSESQAIEFLDELKTLGSLYFADHPIARDALEKAITTQDPTSFFKTCGDTANARSAAFETMSGLLPRGFSFIGDADFSANYLEMAAPTSSHETLSKCREHLLYEPIKDFVLQRLIRHDVWVKRPVQQTADLADLFGHFTFGITTPRERVPTSMTAPSGCVISFASPLFVRLIDLMATLPLSIGDFLGHPAGHGMDPDEVVAAIHVLIACGIAQPMRGRYEGKSSAEMRRPAWATAFNNYLTETTISESNVRLASPIVGGAITLTARDALVLQAINRVGLSDSAGALQPELKKLIAKNPALAAQVMEAVDPTDEIVNNIISSVVTNGLVRWYAYGLLAA